MRIVPTSGVLYRTTMINISLIGIYILQLTFKSILINMKYVLLISNFFFWQMFISVTGISMHGFFPSDD